LGGRGLCWCWWWGRVKFRKAVLERGGDGGLDFEWSL
jgi:hypothetical protein